MDSLRNHRIVNRPWVVNLDPWTNLQAWKGHVDFYNGPHSMFPNRTLTTAVQAEDHMRQFAHQCIDHRLYASRFGDF